LLKAFAIVLEKQPKSNLYMIGDCGGMFEEYYNVLLELAKSLDILERINFVGYTDNPYKYVKYANCLVLPSRNEGLPNVIIESLFLGTPVTVTDSIPVISRIVRNGIDGYVVEVDDVNSVAEAMLKTPDLGRVVSNYKSVTKEDFQNLFI
jgi:glycosyltransferase involved in cell wall biosynthesis